MTAAPFKLGFACSWWHPKTPTWSFTPVSLRQGLLDAGTEVFDIAAQPPLPCKAAIAGALTALGQKPWKYAPAYLALEAHRVRSAARGQGLRAVLGLADVVVPASVPSYAYQDMNYSVAVAHYATLGRNLVSTLPASLATLERMAEHQRRAFAKMAGVFTMGEWYRQHLIHDQGLPAARVHAVGGGISSRLHATHAAPRQPRARAERRRLLFVGTDFYRKGCDQLLAAMQLLRSGGAADLRLTVAGPRQWPQGLAKPEWVTFLGLLPRAEVAGLYRRHDLFVLPSRFEAYGLSFLEARAAGLPAVGRNAFSMPELIAPGRSGALWTDDNIATLAEVILATLHDDVLHERCAVNAAPFAAANTWTRVAERMLQTMRADGRP